jgi:hypothetical protein
MKEMFIKRIYSFTCKSSGSFRSFFFLKKNTFILLKNQLIEEKENYPLEDNNNEEKLIDNIKQTNILITITRNIEDV